MPTARGTPEERRLSEGVSVKCPGCALTLRQNESKAEEKDFIWEGGA